MPKKVAIVWGFLLQGRGMEKLAVKKQSIGGYYYLFWLTNELCKPVLTMHVFSCASSDFKHMHAHYTVIR